MNLSPNSLVAGKLLNFFVADDVQKHQLGTRVDATDSDYSVVANVGNVGGAEMVYARGTTAFGVGRLVHLDKDMNIQDVPVTTGTGRPVFVVVSAFSATAQFGWVCRSGVVPVQFAVAATAGPVFAGAAGNATPTPAAGRQLLNATTLLGSAASFTRLGRLRTGQAQIEVPNLAGLFPGMAVSGTGIPGGATIAVVDPGNLTIRLSANATASGSNVLTYTHTNFGIVHLEQSFVQGQIT
jgi:hypothetical protein